MYFVYRLTCSISGKSYIGITARSAIVRWQEHLQRVQQGSRKSRIYAAMRKYGSASFELEVIDSTNHPDHVRQLERDYIRKFDTYRNGYNANLGGHGLLEVPDDIRRKIGDAQRGKIIPLDTRERMSKAKLGDSRCATHLGAHTNKGAANPRSKRYLIRFPDGTEHEIAGMRQFIRDHGLTSHIRCRGKEKGYTLLGRLND